MDERVKVVAMKLADQDRYGANSPFEVAPGFTVPTWLTYVSRARQLVAERDAFGK
jgi:hypothetical protein